jgi:hypothetical protein
MPPIGATSSARRWSSQTIAGRSGVPVSSATTTVERWVVSVTAAMASLRAMPADQSAAQASPIAHQ